MGKRKKKKSVKKSSSTSKAHKDDARASSSSSSDESGSASDTSKGVHFWPGESGQGEDEQPDDGVLKTPAAATSTTTMTDSNKGKSDWVSFSTDEKEEDGLSSEMQRDLLATDGGVGGGKSLLVDDDALLDSSLRRAPLGEAPPESPVQDASQQEAASRRRSLPAPIRTPFDVIQSSPFDSPRRPFIASASPDLNTHSPAATQSASPFDSPRTKVAQSDATPTQAKEAEELIPPFTPNKKGIRDEITLDGGAEAIDTDHHEDAARSQLIREPSSDVVMTGPSPSLIATGEISSPATERVSTATATTSAAATMPTDVRSMLEALTQQVSLRHEQIVSDMKSQLDALHQQLDQVTRERDEYRTKLSKLKENLAKLSE